MSQFYHVTSQRSMAVIKALTGQFTGPDDLNLIIIKNTCIEVFHVTSEGLKQLRDVPINAKIITAHLFRRKDQLTDSLFILSKNAEVAIIECMRSGNSIEFTTVASGSIADRSARMIDQGFDALVDPEANYIVIKLYHGLLKVICLRSLWNRGNPNELMEPKVKAHSVRIEEGNIVDMAFLHGYRYPTFALIYADEVVLHMKTYDIVGREPSFRNVPLTLDSIEPDSKLLIPVPTPYGGVILAGDNIICYHTKDGPHISQYIPQTKASQVICYAQVDAKRYLLGDMAGRLYMVHLLPDDGSCSLSNAISSNQASSSATPSGIPSQRIGSIRIELLGETVIPESIVYLDNAVVFIASFLGDSQLIRLNPDLEPERNSYITVLEQFTNIGPIIDMVLLESKGQNQLITCSGAFKEGSLRIIRNGIGIQEHASIDQEQIKGVWCFPVESTLFDDAIVVSMVGQTQLLRLADDDITALQLEGFTVNEQTVYCTVISFDAEEKGEMKHPLLLQATTSGLRLIGIQSLFAKGCLATWTPPTDKSVSCLSSFGNLIVVASGSDLYSLRITGSAGTPKFTQVGHSIMPHEVACIDMTPIDKSKVAASASLHLLSPRQHISQSRSLSINSSKATTEENSDANLTTTVTEPEYVAVGLWLGHGLALLRLPSLETVHMEPLPETTASTGTALLPRSILIAQLEEAAFLFVAMGDGSMHYYTIECSSENIFLRDAKRVNAGTGPSMFLSQWRSHKKNNVFVCSNHPCIVYSVKNKLIFANVNLKEVSWMAPINGSYYKDCICLVTPSGLMIGSVDEIQKLHVRSIALDETPRRLALQIETGSLGVLSIRQEVYQEGVGFKAVRPSVSLSTKVPKSASSVPKTMPSSASLTVQKFRDIEVSSLLVYAQSNLELQSVHTFYHNTTVTETAMSIASINLEDGSEGSGGRFVYAVGTALLVKGEFDPTRGRIHLFRWDPENTRLETMFVHDVNGCVYRIIDFNGRILAAIGSSVRLFDVKGDSLRLACSYNENITVLYLRAKGDFVLLGDLMRSLTLLLYKPNMNNFETVGRHRHPRWTTAVEILDDEHFLAAEAEGNIYVTARDSPDNTQEPKIASLSMPPVKGGSNLGGVLGSMEGTGDRSGLNSNANIASYSTNAPTSMPSSACSEMRTLADCAYMHSGDCINTFVKGNLMLAANMEEERWRAVGETACLYGTAQGCLGLIVQLSPILFAFLKEVESRVSRLIIPVGGFNHEIWRAFKGDKVVRMAHNFVDGELIETFLDLSSEEKEKVIADLRIPVSMKEFGTAGSTMVCEPETRICTVEDLTKVVEEMAALH